MLFLGGGTDTARSGGENYEADDQQSIKIHWPQRIWA